MTREQFLNELDRELGFLTFSERREILSDYMAHFASGKADGKSEAQICEDLGSISEIAASYNTGKQETTREPNATFSPVRGATQTPSTPPVTETRVTQAAVTQTQGTEKKVDPFVDTIETEAKGAKPTVTAAPSDKKNGNSEKKSEPKSLVGYNVGIIISTVILFALIGVGLSVVLTLFFTTLIQTLSAMNIFTNGPFAIGTVIFTIGIEFLLIYAVYGLIKGIIKLSKRVVFAIRKNVEFYKGV